MSDEGWGDLGFSKNFYPAMLNLGYDFHQTSQKA